MNDFITGYLAIGMGLLLYLAGKGFSTLADLMRTRLHPKMAEMTIFAISQYLKSTEGKQAAADEQSKRVLEIIEDAAGRY